MLNAFASLKCLKKCQHNVQKPTTGQNRKQKEKQEKPGNEAPPLPEDTVGVHNQKAELTAIQFIIALGICPDLVSGVGFPE